VLTRRVANIERERERALADARQEAHVELADLRERLRRAAALLERSAASRQDLLPAAQELRDAEIELRQLVPPSRRAAPKAPATVGGLKAGDTVLVRSLGQIGQIVALVDGQAEVLLGNFKLRIRLDDLEKSTAAGSAEREARPSSYSTTLVAERSVPLQLDLRGYRAEEVVRELDSYLDDAFLAGLPFARIVHGKGSGVLRQIVRDHLAGHPLVQSYAPGDQREGGEGVTIVKLGR
jgi:DNA mismatch repair protein MutS2